MRIFLAFLIAITPLNAMARTYTTKFPLTESPISENGNWLNGGTDGLDWQNVNTSPSLAYCSVGSPSGFDDPSAVLKGAWGPDQFVTALVSTPTADPDFVQESEIRLRTTIAAHSITGYEVLNSAGGAQIVRWNGALGDFTPLVTCSGAGGFAVNGDTLSASIVGSTIRMYVNGTEILQCTDTTFTSGAPGMGFFSRNPAVAPFGFANFTATDGIPTGAPVIGPVKLTGGLKIR